MANKTAKWLARGFSGLAIGVMASLTACGGSSSPNPGGGPPPSSQKVINLYPAAPPSGNRLYVMVTSVGSTAVNMPLIFDTGSAGITLSASAIFPPTVVTSSGFVFPAGETSISYGGITVTNQQATRTYGGGGPNGTTQIGNIGYATVTFGDSSDTLTTATMPVFLYYSIVLTATGQPITPGPQQGIFGVDSAANVITQAGSTEPADGYPPCSQQSTGTCLTVSVLKYLQYGQGLHPGFLLSPASLQSCDITTAGSCAPQPILTLGLTSAQEAGFNTADLTCPPPGYVGPASMEGYPVCLAAIPQTALAVSGLATGTLTTEVIFDSGTPDMIVRVPAGVTFPDPVPTGADVSIATPSGFTYSYTAAPGITNTVIQANDANQSIVGIAYFTTNSLFVDYGTSTEGWK